MELVGSKLDIYGWNAFSSTELTFPHKRLQFKTVTQYYYNTARIGEFLIIFPHNQSPIVFRNELMYVRLQYGYHGNTGRMVGVHKSKFVYRSKDHFQSNMQLLLKIDTQDLTAVEVQPKVQKVYFGDLADFIFDDQLIVLGTEGSVTIAAVEKKIHKYKKMSCYSCIKRLSPSRKELLIAAINGSGFAHISVFSSQIEPICHLELGTSSRKKEEQFPISDMLSLDTSNSVVHVLCVRKKTFVDLLMYSTVKKQLVSLILNIKVVEDNKPIHAVIMRKGSSHLMRYLIGAYGMIRSIEFIRFD